MDCEQELITQRKSQCKLVSGRNGKSALNPMSIEHNLMAVVVVDTMVIQSYAIRCRTKKTTCLVNDQKRTGWTFSPTCQKSRMVDELFLRHVYLRPNKKHTQSKPVTPRRRWGYPDRCLRCDGRPSTPVLCNAEQ